MIKNGLCSRTAHTSENLMSKKYEEFKKLIEKKKCGDKLTEEEEEKIKDAVNLVRTFTKYPDRTALTDSFIESLKLLADTVESQMEEVSR